MIRTASCLALIALAVPALSAPPTPPSPPSAPAAPAAPPAPTAALKAEYLAEIADVQDKLHQLAEEFPEAKYSWRPAEGIRSVSEVFLHVAGGTYFLTRMAGFPTPADVPKQIEKIVGKKEVIAQLDKSFAHLRAAVAAATPESMAKEVDFFGQKSTVRGMYMKAYGHMSEHLGQAIAYARSTGVVPPWSKSE